MSLPPMHAQVLAKMVEKGYYVAYDEFGGRIDLCHPTDFTLTERLRGDVFRDLTKWGYLERHGDNRTVTKLGAQAFKAGRII